MLTNHTLTCLWWQWKFYFKYDSEKICSLVTLEIALAKELLTLILKLRHFYRLIIFFVSSCTEFKKIFMTGGSNFEWRLFLLEGEKAGQYPITWHDIPHWSSQMFWQDADVLFIIFSLYFKSFIHCFVWMKE